jgi:phage shock protein PspC (stress-responsive transcriptional regulator)
MYCTQCGIQLRGDDNFCSRCGARTGVGYAMNQTRSLMLDKRNKKIGGVCAGFARYFGEDVTLMRVIWLAVALTTGIGFLAYFAAWILMPSDHGLEPRPMPVPQTT